MSEQNLLFVSYLGYFYVNFYSFIHPIIAFRRNKYHTARLGT